MTWGSGVCALVPRSAARNGLSLTKPEDIFTVPCGVVDFACSLGGLSSGLRLGGRKLGAWCSGFGVGAPVLDRGEHDDRDRGCGRDRDLDLDRDLECEW